MMTNFIFLNRRLAAGNPPYMPVYDRWSHCYSQLKLTNQHKRGSSLFWR